MPYHSFFLGGAHRLQAFFGPVEWKEVSLMAISKTTGASYLQTNAPGSMHRPTQRSSQAQLDTGCCPVQHNKTNHSIRTALILYLGLAMELVVMQKTRESIVSVFRKPVVYQRCHTTRHKHVDLPRLYST